MMASMFPYSNILYYLCQQLYKLTLAQMPQLAKMMYIL